MHNRRLRTFVIVGVIGVVLAFGTLGIAALIGPSQTGSDVATPSDDGAAPVGAVLPAHVYAPYFERWTEDSITETAQQSGTTHFTLAFLETLKKGSCMLAWNGDKAQKVADGAYLEDITSLREMGGDVIPSFGGWSADQGGTEIADSCTDVNAIAAAYESVVTTYNVTRLDMDVEGRSLGKPDGIDRRNKAIKLLQDWAAANGRTVQIQYTLPTAADGPDPDSLAVLENAVANGVRVDVVNPMVFDYYDNETTEMGSAAISASEGLHAQLVTLYPDKSDAELWAMQGATMMNGVDDYPKKTELTDLADVQQFMDFAKAKGMSTLSIWAIQRDNGSCAGQRASDDCSGIEQESWAFSHVLEPFTGP
jgi:hypothetical protein